MDKHRSNSGLRVVLCEPCLIEPFCRKAFIHNTRGKSRLPTHRGHIWKRAFVIAAVKSYSADQNDRPIIPNACCLRQL